MNSFTFTKVISKPKAFDAYMKLHATEIYDRFKYDANVHSIRCHGRSYDRIIVYAKRLLNDVEVASVRNLVEAYTDPGVWLTLSHTEQLPMISLPTSSAVPVPLQSIIVGPVIPDSGVCVDGIKTVVQYATENTSAFAGDQSGAILTFEIYCVTTDTIVMSVVQDIASVVGEFQAKSGMAQSANVWRSLQVHGLMTKYPKDSYGVWQYRVGISNPNISVSLHGLQKLYYTMT